MVDRICDNCMNRVPANADKCPKCGIRFENTNPGGALPNGWVLGGRYTVGRYIDIDGEGVTYSAIDANSFQRVLIKEFMPVTLCAARNEYGAIVPKPGCEVLFKTTRMDFGELYGALLAMGHTEGLVGVLDVLEENNTVYTILEKIEGPTLAEYLMRQEYPIESNRALSIMRPVMLGVEALHSANVVHRGISPDNIILESGGTAKLTGYATLALRQQGSELKPKLYAGYSAPEQYTASEFEGRFTDVYAIGAVLYRMVTGETPVPADERRVQDNLRTARSLDKEIPGFLSSGISRAMRVNSDERIQSIGDLRMVLSGESTGRAAVPAGASRKAAAENSDEEKGLFGLTKKQTIIAGVAVGAVLLILLIVLLVAIFGGGGKPASSSSSEVVSSSSAPVDEMRVPNFVNQKYEDVIKNKTYTDVYTFASTYEEEYSDEIAEGYIISQTPDAGTAWGEDSEPITFVVSKGKEPVKMPDFVSVSTTQAEAELALKNLDVEYNVITEANNGQYTAGMVIRTDPPAGSEVVPGKDKVTIYVASAAAGQAMPNLVGKTQTDAVNELKGMGIAENRIKVTIVANDGKFVAGTVVSTSPNQGENVITGSDTVTISVYDKVYMPDLNSSYTGQSQDSLVNWLNERKANYVYNIEEVTNDGSHAAGTIASVTSSLPVNSEVKPGTVITIKVYGQPPATPPPTSGE